MGWKGGGKEVEGVEPKQAMRKAVPKRKDIKPHAKSESRRRHREHEAINHASCCFAAQASAHLRIRMTFSMRSLSEGQRSSSVHRLATTPLSSNAAQHKRHMIKDARVSE